jgi:hypothetical protein
MTSADALAASSHRLAFGIEPGDHSSWTSIPDCAHPIRRGRRDVSVPIARTGRTSPVALPINLRCPVGIPGGSPNSRVTSSQPSGQSASSLRSRACRPRVHGSSVHPPVRSADGSADVATPPRQAPRTDVGPDPSSLMYGLGFTAPVHVGRRRTSRSHLPEGGDGP